MPDRAAKALTPSWARSDPPHSIRSWVAVIKVGECGHLKCAAFWPRGLTRLVLQLRVSFCLFFEFGMLACFAWSVLVVACVCMLCIWRVMWRVVCCVLCVARRIFRMVLRAPHPMQNPGPGPASIFVIHHLVTWWFNHYRKHSRLHC